MNNTQRSIPYLLLQSARPRQWMKNLSLYAALVFSGLLFHKPVNDLPYSLTVTFAFIIFSMLTSAVYMINDIIDSDADRLHPFKSKRPIASGRLPIPYVSYTIVLLLVGVFFFTLWLTPFFRLTLIAYMLLQVLYTLKTKHIAILDVLSIATGFVLRVYAGAVVVNLHMNVWFLLTVVSASLFLAVGKRQSERTLLGADDRGKILGETRKTLRRYSQRLLDQFTGMFASATWLTYALFAFQGSTISPEGGFLRLFTILPKTLQSQKLLMLTVPIVIFGVMRYMQLIYEDNQGESPEKVLLRDKPLLAAVGLFGCITLIVLYVLS